MSGFEWTDEQKKAIRAMKFFLDYSNESEFVLIGSAGTGKSTIIREVLKGRNRKSILGITVSHAAKNVLNEINGEYMNCMTIASAFSLRRTITAKGKETFIAISDEQLFRQGKSRPVDEAKILVVDECSMIDSDMLAMIRKKVQTNTKIIFCGDVFQLPPVNEPDDSPTFEIMQRAVMTVPVRYDKLIGETAAYYRYLIELYRERGDEGFDWSWLFDWMPKKTLGSTTITYTSKDNDFFTKAIDYFANDSYSSRILCYRNDTINAYNAKLRSLFYSEEKHPYSEGEQIIMNKPYYKTGTDAHNGEIYVVKSLAVDVEKVTYPILVGNRFDKKSKDIHYYIIRAEGNIGGSTKEIILKVPHENSESDITQIDYELLNQAQKDKKLWGYLYSFRERWADISYTYAMSTHKAQGQTLQNVLVNANDILAVRKTDIKTKLQSLYVATTRAKTNLLVLLNKDQFM